MHEKLAWACKVMIVYANEMLMVRRQKRNRKMHEKLASACKEAVDDCLC